MHRNPFLITLCALALLALACGDSAPPELTTDDPELLATYDAGEIRIADLDAYLLTLPAAARRPSAEEGFGPWIRQRFDDLFVRTVLSSPDSVETAQADPAFETGWAARRKSALARRYLANLGLEVVVTNEEVESYFSENQEAMRTPEQRIVRNLLLSFPEGATDTKKDAVCVRAQELRLQLLGGASFEEMAKRYSTSSTAAAGGLVGMVRRSQLRGDIAETIFTLESGEVSSVVRNAAGCQLFYVQQIQPEFEATLETVGTRIAERIRERKSGEVLARQVRDAVSQLGLEMPTWPPAPEFDPAERDRVLFELDGETVTVGAVLGRVNRQIPPAAALMQLVSELTLSHLLATKNPTLAVEAERQAKAAFAAQFLARRKLQDQVAGLDEETLRTYFERHQDQFQSDPKVELTLYSWPIERGDPVRSMERPRSFANRLRAGEEGEALFQEFSGDPGAKKSSVPLTDLRLLLTRQPEIGRQLFGDFTEGEVLGPYRVTNRLEVLRVETLIPGRPLSFLEALDPLRARYATSEADTLEEEWRHQLRDAHDLQIFEANLDNFGTRLVDQLRGLPATAATATATATDATTNAANDVP